MKKSLKIIFTILLVVFTYFTFFNYSFADNITTNQSVTNTNSGKITPTVSSMNPAEETSRLISNIINVLLISVGIVIIFLAIAILVKLKDLKK